VTQVQSSLQPQTQPQPQSQPQPQYQAEHSSGSSAFTSWPFNPDTFLAGDAPVADSGWKTSQQNIIGDPWLLNSNFDLAGIESDMAAREYTDSPLCSLCSLRHVMFIIPT
jgi:hypothetical protein